MDKFAIYDLDRTITRVGTFTPFLLFAARRRPWRLPLMAAYFLAMPVYKLGMISRRTLKELGFRTAIGSHVSQSMLGRLCSAYADHVCKTNLHAHVTERIRRDRDEGWTLVMATAALEIYASEIGRRLGFDHVIATKQQEHDAGGYSHRIEGENCYAAAKREAIEAWLPGPREGAQIRFYSDHHSDEPVFAWCDVPIAVNPNARMLALAEQRGWQVLPKR